MSAKIICMEQWKFDHGLPLAGQEQWWDEQESVNCIEEAIAAYNINKEDG